MNSAAEEEDFTPFAAPPRIGEELARWNLTKESMQNLLWGFQGQLAHPALERDQGDSILVDYDDLCDLVEVALLLFEHRLQVEATPNLDHLTTALVPRWG